MKTTGRQRANVANHDTAVAAVVTSARRGAPIVVAALLAWATLPACAAPAPAADATSVVRIDGPDVEAEGDGEGADLAPAVVARPEGQLEWISSEEEGAVQSKAERRPMLVSFATEWCGACKRLVKETFADPRVKSEAGRFVAVRIDATNDEDPQVGAALLKYAVIGLPTIVLLDSEGHEQRRFTEFVRPDALLAEIERVH
jgi:thiol-disulfide isomerase/thioredoxin